MTSITITRPAPVATPRGAIWAAEIAARVLSFLNRLMTEKQERSEQARRVAEAAQVRQLAAAWQFEDHRIAADLYAAADRHERS